jgi:TatD DNase family protein
MKYIDIHAHLNFSDQYPDIDELAQKTKEQSVTVINIGTGEKTSQRAVELAKRYDHMYAVIGLHPIYAAPSYASSEVEAFDFGYYRELVTTSDSIIGIGECGFDYYHCDENGKQLQDTAFRAQLEFAGEHDLPVMLHIRSSQGTYDAYEDALAVIHEYKEKFPNLTGDVHFFAGTTDIAQEFLDLGFYISFTGVITFAPMYNELVEAIPMDRILSETDAPYVAPTPFRGERNEPSHVREVVKKIAEIKNLDEEVVAEKIMENAKRLFKLS